MIPQGRLLEIARALFTGKWAGPWVPDPEPAVVGWCSIGVRLDRHARVLAYAGHLGTEPMFGIREQPWIELGDQDGGQAEADATLLAAGWVLLTAEEAEILCPPLLYHLGPDPVSGAR